MARTRQQFDLKFGDSFVSGLPGTPAVYRIYNEAGLLIYIGKAKNLRRRIQQYRNAKRRKRHQKMRLIVAEARRIEYETLPSDLEACLREAELIQTHRPKWNVDGAFFFLYPMIGMSFADVTFSLCLTNQPEKIPGGEKFSFHGAFRSRHFCAEAFFSLGRLLTFIGHSVKLTKSERAKLPKFSYVIRFRRIPPEWMGAWADFWTGGSRTALEELILALVENAGARRKPKEIQKHLNHLKRFWRHEAQYLSQARKATGYIQYPVPQKERDLLILKYRFAVKELGSYKDRLAGQTPSVTARSSRASASPAAKPPEPPAPKTSAD